MYWVDTFNKIQRANLEIPLGETAATRTDLEDLVEPVFARAIALEFDLGLPNQPPVAQCQSPTVSADASCEADVSVDAGSFDPDGDPITLAQVPASPYGLGSRTVTLTVMDDSGDFDTCTAMVTVQDTTAPAVTAALVPVGSGDDDEGRFRVVCSCTDNCDPSPALTCTLNGIAVDNGQIVELEIDDETEVEREDGILEIEAPSFELVATCTDASGNVGMATAAPTGLGADNDDD